MALPNVLEVSMADPSSTVTQLAQILQDIMNRPLDTHIDLSPPAKPTKSAKLSRLLNKQVADPKALRMTEPYKNILEARPAINQSLDILRTIIGQHIAVTPTTAISYEALVLCLSKVTSNEFDATPRRRPHPY